MTAQQQVLQSLINDENVPSYQMHDLIAWVGDDADTWNSMLNEPDVLKLKLMQSNAYHQAMDKLEGKLIRIIEELGNTTSLSAEEAEDLLFDLHIGAHGESLLDILRDAIEYNGPYTSVDDVISLLPNEQEIQDIILKKYPNNSSTASFVKGFAYDPNEDKLAPFFSQYDTSYDPHVRKTRETMLTNPDEVTNFKKSLPGDFKLEAKHFGEQPGFSAALSTPQAQKELFDYLMDMYSIKDMIREADTMKPNVVTRTYGKAAPEKGLAGWWHKYLEYMQAVGPKMNGDKLVHTDDTYVMDPKEYRDRAKKMLDRYRHNADADKFEELQNLVNESRIIDAAINPSSNLSLKDASISLLYNKYPNIFTDNRADIPQLQQLKKQIQKDALKLYRKLRPSSMYKGEPLDMQEANVQRVADKFNPPTKLTDFASDIRKQESKHFNKRAEEGKVSDERMKNMCNSSMQLENIENTLYQQAQRYTADGTADLEGQLKGEAEVKGATPEEAAIIASRIKNRLTKINSGHSSGALGKAQSVSDRVARLRNVISSMKY